ncbi:MAG: hypothetical protein HQL33_07850 [Alphaproteobacteria bacterium]|nr:hypothetical protein [Alphaproteobacteria bacterium]
MGLHGRGTLLAAAAWLVGLQAVLAVTGWSPILSGRFADGDGYMWLLRVLDLHAGAPWYGAVSARTNAPFGESLHWTRPLDALLYAGAWIGTAVAGFRQSLFVWGALVSPLLLLLSLPVWSWGMRPLLDDRTFLLSVALFPLLFQLSLAFEVGRPDHHGLLAFLFIVQFAIAVRLAMGLAGMRAAAAAGAVCGLALWVSVESLLALASIGGGLAALWIARGGEHARHLAAYAVALFVALSIAIPVQVAPAEWTMPVYRHVSVVHWTLAGAGAAVWLGLAVLAPRARAGRAGLVLGGAVLVGGVMAALFPRFFSGPFAEYDPAITAEFLSQIAEFESLLPRSRYTASMFLIYLGPPLIAISFALWRWRRADFGERGALLLFGSGFLVYLPMAIYEVRWVSYVEILSLVHWPMAVVAMDRLGRSRASVGGRVLARSLAAVVLIVGNLIAAAPLFASAPSAVSPAVQGGDRRRGCDWTAISRTLTERHALHPEERIVLTYFFAGPELAWRTPYDVVGAPYANADSLGDTARFFRATQDGDARAVAERRKIDLVLLCAGYPDNRFHGRGDGALLNRLLRGEGPEWLEPVPLPAGAVPVLRLFRVTSPGRDGPARSSDSGS